MINLLSSTAKKRIQKEYRLRLSVIALCALFILELSAVAFFTKPYMVLRSSTEELTQQLAAKSKLVPKADEEIPAKLLAIGKELTLLKPPEGVPATNPSVLLGELLANKPKGIAITAFNYSVTGGIATIVLSGSADTRENLIAFQKLLKTPRVAAVKFPGSFITKKAPIDFTVTVTFK